ncbi:MAG: hypothetical protein J6K72_04910 [Clostridia bacterium]|nr:hypothetical protein [Clostridia bacterium]
MKKMVVFVAFCVLLGAAFLLWYFAGEDLLTGTFSNIVCITFSQEETTVTVPADALPDIKSSLQAYARKARQRNAADYTLPDIPPCSFTVLYEDGTSNLFSYSENLKLLYRYTREDRKKIMLVYDPDFTLLHQLEALLPEEPAGEDVLFPDASAP